MKGYILFILLIAAVLLLLPLAALPRTQTTVAPPPVSGDPPTTSTTAPTTPPAAVTETFKVLSGDTVTTLDCREFLIRTLAFEMSPTDHPEALKAQAVAAYTYYGRRRRAQEKSPDPALKGAHFVSPDAKFPAEYSAEKLQAKWGAKYAEYHTALAAAVDAVTGIYLTHNGEWIDACYFAMSNGSTESAKTVWGDEVPYLQAVASPGDKLAAGYETAVTRTPAEVKSALLTADAALVLGDDPAAWFGTPATTATGSVATLPVGGKTLSGTAVRAALGLRSATFSVAYKDGTFTFTTHGYGHGVGMSQCGADYLARQGYSWQEILQYYYKNVTIVNAP